MDKLINLKDCGHSASLEIKELHLESETDGVGCYKVIAHWPDGEPYLRILSDPDNNHIVGIDFDGGPFLSIGSLINDKYIVTGFNHNDFKDVKILLVQCSS